MNARPATTRLPTLPRVERRELRIAVLAPPWIPVPPLGYGGIEAVVALTCEGLVARGHEVTLFAAPGSHSAAHMHSPLQGTHADQIGSSVYESDHVGAAYDAIENAASEDRPFDVLHDHSGFTAVAMAHRLSVPVVHTLHAPFNDEMRPFYTRHGHKVRLVAISRFQLEHAPPGVGVADVVPNPIRVEDWPFCEDKDDYLLWMGRMDAAKGAASEIVIHGENGFLLADEQAMAEAVGRLDAIGPLRCRESVASRYNVTIVAEGYESVYDRAIQAAASQGPRFVRRVQSVSRWNDRAERVMPGAARASTLQPTG